MDFNNGFKLRVIVPVCTVFKIILMFKIIVVSTGARILNAKCTFVSQHFKTMFRIPATPNAAVRSVTGKHVLVSSTLGKLNRPTLKTITLT